MAFALFDTAALFSENIGLLVVFDVAHMDKLTGHRIDHLHALVILQHTATKETRAVFGFGCLMRCYIDELVLFFFDTQFAFGHVRRSKHEIVVDLVEPGMAEHLAD